MLARTARTTTRLALALVALLALGACSINISATTQGDEAEQDRSVDTATGEYVSTALVAEAGDSVLFIDQDTETPYVPTLPEGQVFGADGEQIDGGDLEVGNVVRVTGNGIMLESYPGQYPGIAKVEVIDEGSPESIEPYEDILAQITAERDPSEPPSAFVEYRTDHAVVSVLLPTFGYTWSFEENGETQTVIADAAHPVQCEAADLNDVAVGETAEVTVGFDEPALGAVVERWSEAEISAAAEAAGSVLDINPDDLAAETSAVTADDDGALSLTVEPGYRYSLTVKFEAGTVTYAFTVR